MFTASNIHDHKRKQPFVPFRLVTSSGESFDIVHPELIMIGMREVAIGLPSINDPSIYENQVWVSIMHITSIKEIPVAGASSAGNGKGA